MSQKDADDAASKFIGTLHLGRDLFRQSIDLTPHAEALAQFEGIFRRMVFQAIERKLKKRGAHSVTLPPL